MNAEHAAGPEKQLWERNKDQHSNTDDDPEDCVLFPQMTPAEHLEDNEQNDQHKDEANKRGHVNS
ncbi:hypothetical protein StoSoilB19_25500 [Arthrobacter sp. StoSoilB19]|nr:hypothetical protein StoSoilB19_25500 [Arthrobacter sp. StoSoilB19]